MDSNPVNLKSLDKEMTTVASKYFAALRNLKLLSAQSGEVDPLNPYLIYLRKVTAAFDSLCEEDKKFINNEYFYQEYPNWWQTIYTQSSFYRIKKRSLENFLEAFHAETK